MEEHCGNENKDKANEWHKKHAAEKMNAFKAKLKAARQHQAQQETKNRQK